MQKDIHPSNYRPCVFKDMGTEEFFITRSCAETRDNIEIDGVEYTLIKMEISAASHPFYTGKVKLVDTAGRVDKFRNRYKGRNQA
jgi:large subunit ribosomal protein L31